MPIEHHRGGTTLTGDSISFYRLCVMRGAVGLELKGIKMTRGPVVWKQAAREFGIKGNKQAVYDWLDAKVQELRAQQEHIENGRRTVGGEDVQ
jgi:hypothetical protein